MSVKQAQCLQFLQQPHDHQPGVPVQLFIHSWHAPPRAPHASAPASSSFSGETTRLLIYVFCVQVCERRRARVPRAPRAHDRARGGPEESPWKLMERPNNSSSTPPTKYAASEVKVRQRLIVIPAWGCLGDRFRRRTRGTSPTCLSRAG